MCARVKGFDEFRNGYQLSRRGIAADLPDVCAVAAREVLNCVYDSERLVTNTLFLCTDTARDEAARRLHGARVQSRANVSRSGAAADRKVDLPCDARR